MKYPFNHEVTQGQRKNTLDLINQLKAAFPYLVQLTPEERQSAMTVADRREPFVNKSLDYARKNPVLFPGFMDLDRFKNDVDVLNFHKEVLRLLEPFMESLKDTMFTAGDEAYRTSTAFYRNVDLARKNGVVATDAIFTDLAKLFPNAPRRNGNDNPDEPEAVIPDGDAPGPDP